MWVECVGVAAAAYLSAEENRRSESTLSWLLHATVPAQSTVRPRSDYSTALFFLKKSSDG